MTLFNPNETDFAEFDPATRHIFNATIAFFEGRGKEWLLQQDRDRVWVDEFLDFQKEEMIFATLLTPSELADGDPHKRWDEARVAKYSQILGFYGMSYWYVWQVTILGLGPIWQSSNASIKRKAAQLLDEGAIFAFGLSERERGADVYTSDMVLTPDGEGGYRANGGKYYIGNGNKAGMVSVFGRVEGRPTGPKTQDGYVFFVVDSQHPAYRLRKNVVDSQIYVAAFELEDYPIREEDIIHVGSEAFDAAINTVNVGKFNIGLGALGATQHVWHEGLSHADSRVLFDTRVTDFPQVRANFIESWVRLAAMDLFSERAVDYMRSGDHDDRRYLLFNAIEKMTVSRQGARVYELIADCIAARGFENDMYYPVGAVAMMGLPRLEGTVHVNMALSLKFLKSYLFSPNDPSLALLALPMPNWVPGAAYTPAFKVSRASIRAAHLLIGSKLQLPSATSPALPQRIRDTTDDAFLWSRRPASGLGEVAFHDWRAVYRDFTHVPNVAILLEQVDAFQSLLGTAPLDRDQMRDLDLLLVVGDIFTTVAYGDLILQQAKIWAVDNDLVDSIFEVLVGDISAHALTLTRKPSLKEAQVRGAYGCLRRPAFDAERTERVWAEARATAGSYAMTP